MKLLGKPGSKETIDSRYWMSSAESLMSSALMLSWRCLTLRLEVGILVSRLLSVDGVEDL